MVLSWTDVRCSKKSACRSDKQTRTRCWSVMTPMGQWPTGKERWLRLKEPSEIQYSVLRTYHPIGSQWKWGMREESYPIPTNLVSRNHRNQTNKIRKSFFHLYWQLTHIVTSFLGSPFILSSWPSPKQNQFLSSSDWELNFPSHILKLFRPLFITAGTQVLNILSKKAISAGIFTAIME